MHIEWMVEKVTDSERVEYILFDDEEKAREHARETGARRILTVVSTAQGELPEWPGSATE